MARARSPLVEAALELAWSHWTGLGVRGTAQPPDTAVDPEALVYFTALLADRDPRLWDEVTDWWLRFQRFVSRSRMVRFARLFDSSSVERVHALDKKVGTNARTSGKSRVERLDSRARALLRMRCLFGTSARAELVLALSTQWGGPEGATALALTELGYGKRNIAETLDELRLAGVVATARDGNRTSYRLADPAALAALLAPLPSHAGRWHLRLPLLAAFVGAADRLDGKDPLVQAAEGRKLQSAHERVFATLGLAAPAIASQTDYWPRLQEWLAEHVAREPSRRLPRMVEGVWFASGTETHKPTRFSSAVLPTLDADPDRDRELRCLDLVQVPTVEPPNDWAWAVLSDAARNVYVHSSGLSEGASLVFATWDYGALRTYRTQLGPPIPHSKIADRYGALASKLARTDKPAVQLVLTRES